MKRPTRAKSRLKRRLSRARRKRHLTAAYLKRRLLRARLGCGAFAPGAFARGSWGSDVRRVEMAEIQANDFNLNISRYVSIAEPEQQIDLAATHRELVEIEAAIRKAAGEHNRFLSELGLAPLPSPAADPTDSPAR